MHAGLLHGGEHRVSGLVRFSRRHKIGGQGSRISGEFVRQRFERRALFEPKRLVRADLESWRDCRKGGAVALERQLH